MNKGLMQFKVVPFELINARVTFNCMMRKLFDEAANVEEGWEEHNEAMRKVF